MLVSRSKQRIPLSIALTLLIAANSLVVIAQEDKWRVYSSPDKKFSIELPSPLTRVKSFDGKHGVDFDPEQDKYGSSYVARESPSGDARFGIISLNGRAKFLAAPKRSRTIEGLSWLLIADEDELQFMRPATMIKRNGLIGREYFYIKAKTINSPLFTRGRIFDTGDMIYVMVFIGRDQEDLTSADAERFFNSFRLSKQRHK